MVAILSNFYMWHNVTIIVEDVIIYDVRGTFFVIFMRIRMAHMACSAEFCKCLFAVNRTLSNPLQLVVELLELFLLKISF